MSYKDAGVDIDAGSELVRRIAALTPGIGGFGGLFPLGKSPLSGFTSYSIIRFNRTQFSDNSTGKSTFTHSHTLI